MPPHFRGVFCKAVPLLLVMLGLAASARADVIYTFTYTAQSGPFESTTFQLDEPDFLTPGTYSITPFTISDGSTNFSFTQLNVGTLASDSCFDFATATGNVDTCSGGTSPGSEASAFIFSIFDVSVPTTPEMLATNELMLSGNPPNFGALENGSGTLTLDITQTPEPATAPLVGVFLLAAATFAIWRRSRRSSTHRPA
jgi:hypothetical protein